MQSQSLELTAGDFDAYLPERASSNVYSRPRLEFKQRALGWARHVVERLQAIGIPMDVHGSDEHPSVRNGHRVDSQWVFFWRSQKEREALDGLLDQRGGIADTLRDPSPYYRHAFLALRLDSDKIEVSAQVHPDAWVDFESFRSRLARDSAPAIVEAIASLPEQFHFGISGREVEPAGTVTVEALQRIVQRVQEESAAVWIGWTIPRDVAIEHAEILDEQLEDALAALGPVYQRLAWREDDDPAGLKDALDKMRADLAEAATHRAQLERKTEQENARARQQQTEKSRERTKERVDYDANRARPTLANLFKPASGDPEPPRVRERQEARQGETKAPHGAPPPAAMPHPEPRAGRRPASPKPREVFKPAQQQVSRPRRPQPTAPTYVTGGSVDKGAQVRVLSGPFVGKVGILGELDGRGGARVLLGLLSTRLLVEQLEAVVEAKDRPSLQSSHRRDGLLGRSGK